MYYLAIQNNYGEVQLALMSESTQTQADSIPKTQASKELIVCIDKLLTSANLQLSDLSFIVANQGPGPFTTLRVVITTVNGLAYAKQIPLIGINALEAALAEWHDPAYPTTAILFNAFGNDVYALVAQNSTRLLYGVYPIETLLKKMQEISGSIRFLGNGTQLHHELIQSYFSDNAYIPSPHPDYCSVAQIAQMGLKEWHKQSKGEKELLPLYLKRHPADLS